MLYEEERQAVADCCRRMLTAGLTTGAGGNVSLRVPDTRHVCVSPTGIEYDVLRADQVPVVDLDAGLVEGDCVPSSETPMHLAVYRWRPAVHAVVHTHSPYASTFACLRREIRPVHYLVGFAGVEVPVAEYATYGTDELADNAIAALGQGNAVLLANHGLLAVGTTLSRAFTVAEELELVARLQYQAEAIGTPVLLPDEEMRRIIKKFATYGQQPGREEG